MCLGNKGFVFCSQRRDRDVNRAWLIASGVASSLSYDWQANGQRICLPALPPTCEASLSPQLGLCPIPIPVWASSNKDILLSWLILTFCTTILVDSKSALNQFHCIQFLTELGWISAALLSPRNTLVVYFGCFSLLCSPSVLLLVPFAHQVFLPLLFPERCPCCHIPFTESKRPQWGWWTGPLAAVPLPNHPQPCSSVPSSHSPCCCCLCLLLASHPSTTRSSGKLFDKH